MEKSRPNERSLQEFFLKELSVIIKKPIQEVPIEENTEDKLLLMEKRLLELEKSIHVSQIPVQSKHVVRSSVQRARQDQQMEKHQLIMFGGNKWKDKKRQIIVKSLVNLKEEFEKNYRDNS